MSRIEDTYANDLAVVRVKDGNPAHRAVLDRLRVQGHPTVILLDRNGEEKSRWLGPRAYEDLDPEIEALVIH